MAYTVQDKRMIRRLARSKKLMTFLTASAAIFTVNSASAQGTPPPLPSPSVPAFVCSGEIYQVQSGQLRVFDPISSEYVDVGTASSSYNATGYNILDNFAYGSQGNNLIRIGMNGEVQILRDIGVGSFAGDVDDNNTYWLRGRNTREFISVDLANGAINTFTIPGGDQVNGGSDFMFTRNGGVPYLLVVGGGRVGIVNLNTMRSIRRTVSGLPGGGYGAQWTDFNGRIFAFRNSDGRIYELFNVFTNNPTAVLAAQGDSSNNNDGFSCPGAPFPNLPPVAQDDDFTTPFETAITRNVIANNGNGVDFDPESEPVTVTTTPVSSPSNGTVLLNADGSFTYTPDAGFFGTDSFDYQITDITGLTATATVTITVPAPPIDLVTVKTLASGNPNPAAGDIVTFEIRVTNNGPADATGVSLTDQIPTGLNPTANNGTTTLGSYNSSTGVWDIGTLTNGASATLTIEGIVDGSVAGQPITNTTSKAEGDQVDPTDTGNDLMEGIIIFPRSLAANSDTSADIISSEGSTNALNVYDGDTLAGLAATPANTTVSVDSSSSLPPELTFDTATGVVGVLPGTAPGPYSFVYQICETPEPAAGVNCETATATVNVVANPIDAVNDEVFDIVGLTGGTAVLNVFDGDSLSNSAATSSNSDISVADGSTVPAGLTFNLGTGNIDVAAGTAAGMYSFDYTLCETSNPSNCDTATATVIVIEAPIQANAITFPSVIGADGASNAGNAFDNDTLAGSAVNMADITANVTMPATPVRTGANVPLLDAFTGVVSVPVGTPAGVYTIGYRICEAINPTNCSVASVTIEVTAAAIIAVDDSQSDVDGVAGVDNVLNAFTDDTLNTQTADPTNTVLALAPSETLPSELTFDLATGDVDVLPNTPAGTYSFDYQICETINPANCDVATITVNVFPTVDLVITKTNTPGVNAEADQADDTVTSGTITTYTITVTNNGPDSISGAIVTDTIVSGLNCDAGNAVLISGDGVPSGSFTIADLIGGGITLGTLEDRQTTIISYDCLVN